MSNTIDYHAAIDHFTIDKPNRMVHVWMENGQQFDVPMTGATNTAEGITQAGADVFKYLKEHYNG